MSSHRSKGLSNRGRSAGNHRQKDDEELLVFGYACRIFDSDERAEQIADERHLIAWHEDVTIKIDRMFVRPSQALVPHETRITKFWYDCRLHLHSLDDFTTEPGTSRRLSSNGHPEEEDDAGSAERMEEEMCDEERYRDLRAEIRRQEAERENRRRNEIGFNYGDCGNSDRKAMAESSSSEEELDEPFEPPSDLKLPVGLEVPETMKQNAVIEKTALFVVNQGPQMEIVIKAKQRHNLEMFGFLEFDNILNPYYKYISKLIREKKYTPRPHEPKRRPKAKKVLRMLRGENWTPARKPNDAENVKLVEVSDPSDSDSDDGDGYLHPSLLGGATGALNSHSGTQTPRTAIVEEAPLTMPTIPNYKFGQGDDIYSALFKKLSQFMPEAAATLNEREAESKREAELQTTKNCQQTASVMSTSAVSPSTSMSPPIRTDDYAEWFYSFYGRPAPYPVQPNLIPPPPDLAPVVSRTAQFVAKHGASAENHLRMRTDLKMDFLHPSHPYYSHYQMRIRYYQWEQSQRSATVSEAQLTDSSATLVVPSEPMNRRRRRRLGFHEPPPEFRGTPPPPPIVTLVDLPLKKSDSMPVISRNDQTQGNENPTTSTGNLSKQLKNVGLSPGPISFAIATNRTDEGKQLLKRSSVLLEDDMEDGEIEDAVDNRSTGTPQLKMESESVEGLLSPANDESNVPSDLRGQLEPSESGAGAADDEGDDFGGDDHQERQQERKEKARAFMEKILNEKRRRVQGETPEIVVNSPTLMNVNDEANLTPPPPPPPPQPPSASASLSSMLNTANIDRLINAQIDRMMPSMPLTSEPISGIAAESRRKLRDEEEASPRERRPRRSLSSSDESPRRSSTVEKKRSSKQRRHDDDNKRKRDRDEKKRGHSRSRSKSREHRHSSKKKSRRRDHS